MDYRKFIVSSQKEESISRQRVNDMFPGLKVCKYMVVQNKHEFFY